METTSAFQWIDIYLVDSTIQLLNNLVHEFISSFGLLCNSADMRGSPFAFSHKTAERCPTTIQSNSYFNYYRLIRFDVNICLFLFKTGFLTHNLLVYQRTNTRHKINQFSLLELRQLCFYSCGATVAPKRVQPSSNSVCKKSVSVTPFPTLMYHSCATLFVW